MSWGSAFQTGEKAKRTYQSALPSEGLGYGGMGIRRTQIPRDKKEQLQSQAHLLLQLPGLLSAEKHLVPGLLVGVRHQRVPVVRSQLWEKQLSGRAGPGRAWRGWGSWACVGQNWSRQVVGGPLCWGAGQRGGPHPLPGLLQVVPQDFADLLFLVLGECWQDALSRQGLGVNVPRTTWYRLGPQNSCDFTACWTEPEGHPGVGPGEWAKPQVLSVTLQLPLWP